MPKSPESLSPLGLIIFIVLLVALIAILPKWPYSRKWGYIPSGIITAFLVILIFLVLLNYVPRGF